MSFNLIYLLETTYLIKLRLHWKWNYSGTKSSSRSITVEFGEQCHFLYGEHRKGA